MQRVATAESLATRRRVERAIFKYGNRFLMVPLLRTGFGRFMGSPLNGYILLLRTVGRKSGQLRYTPLNYCIDGGCVYCLAGFGEGTHWLANLRSDPRVQAKLPGRVVEGIAEDVSDPAEARRLALKVARSCGLALLVEDPRCMFMSDRELSEQLEGRPVVRIRPLDAPLVSGPYDPGGKGWVWLMLLQVVPPILLVLLLRRRRVRR